MILRLTIICLLGLLPIAGWAGGVDHGQERGGGSGLSAEFVLAAQEFFRLNGLDLNDPNSQVRDFIDRKLEILPTNDLILSCTEEWLVTSFDGAEDRLIIQTALWSRMTWGEKVVFAGSVATDARDGFINAGEAKIFSKDVFRKYPQARCAYKADLCKKLDHLEQRLIDFIDQRVQGGKSRFEAEGFESEILIGIERARIEYLRSLEGKERRVQSRLLQRYVSQRFLPLFEILQSNLENPIRINNCSRKEQ